VANILSTPSAFCSHLPVNIKIRGMVGDDYQHHPCGGLQVRGKEREEGRWQPPEDREGPRVQ